VTDSVEEGNDPSSSSNFHGVGWLVGFSNPVFAISK
jgi:hypothetical protein